MIYSLKYGTHPKEHKEFTFEKRIKSTQMTLNKHT